MKRITSRLSLVLVLLPLVVWQPLPAGAADCSAEEAAFAQLIKDRDDLKNDIELESAKIADAEHDLKSILTEMNTLQHSLEGQPERVQQELLQKMGLNAMTVVAVSGVLTLAIVLAGPEGWGLLVEPLAALADGAEKVHTASEMYALYGEGVEAASALDDVMSNPEHLGEARAFADENDLPQLKFMINQEERMAALSKKWGEAWGRLKHAAGWRALFQRELDDLKQPLQDAQAALYACLDKAGPTPSACEGQATNPNGAGVCR